MKPCQVNLAMKALHAHGFDSTNIHQFLSGLTWPSQFATEAKAATVAFKGKPASFTASASQCLSLYAPLRYYISTLGVNNSAAYVSFISLVELLELLHHSMRKVIDAEERSVWFSLQGFSFENHKSSCFSSDIVFSKDCFFLRRSSAGYRRNTCATSNWPILKMMCCPNITSHSTWALCYVLKVTYSAASRTNAATSS